jgi:hypothetical protein
MPNAHISNRFLLRLDWLQFSRQLNGCSPSKSGNGWLISFALVTALLRARVHGAPGMPTVWSARVGYGMPLWGF